MDYPVNDPPPPLGLGWVGGGAGFSEISLEIQLASSQGDHKGLMKIKLNIINLDR